MHHNLGWMHELNIQHATSTFDTDPFEPQPDGVNTIFPFWVVEPNVKKGYVELPYTLPQDFTLFILMDEADDSIWRKKVDWIAENGGMALLNSHSDYMQFNKNLPLRPETYPVDVYIGFLQYVQERYKGRYWNALPREVSQFCIDNLQAINHYLPHQP
jgi:hypothetical protein